MPRPDTTFRQARRTLRDEITIFDPPLGSHFHSARGPVNASALAEESITGPLASKLSGTPPALAIGGASAREISQKIKAGEIELAKPVTDLPPGVEASYDVEFGKGGTKPLLARSVQAEGDQKAGARSDLRARRRLEEGSRKNYGTYCRHFAGKGYVVATIEYRLSGEAPFPAAIQDVNCAIRWMRANAAKLGVDPDKIGLVGGSAGGHLVLLAAVRAERSRTRGNRGQQRRQLARASGCRYLWPRPAWRPHDRSVQNGAAPIVGPVAAIYGG